MSVIEVRDLTKSFKGKKAVDQLNVTFESGKIYALLGRNAVGKTTLMRLMTTKYIADAGSITYNGEEVFENEKALRKMCMFSDDMPGFVGIKIKKLLKMAEVFYEGYDKEYAKYLIEEFDLDVNARYSNLSKGQKTAVAIVLGLSSRCEFTIFDEIYSGLDAVMRKQFYRLLLEEYSERERTFILSTHLIDEMSNLFTDVVIMEHGKVLLEQEIEELKHSVLSFRAPKEKKAFLHQVEIITESEFAGTSTWIVKGEFSQKVLEDFKNQGFEITALSLQDIFVALTENERR
ncbi:MAG: ABC transporter ATP-binding protein [bacterium]|nr:ABC transporter ATP-binding protein [bacterium]